MPQTDPAFELTAPALRHVYMLGLVWKISDTVNPDHPARPCRILEIGSWAGLSALTWAAGLDTYFGGGELVCVDPWVPYTHCAKNEDPINAMMDAKLQDGSIYDEFLRNMERRSSTVSLTTHRKTSAEALPLFEPASLDIVFVDGDHALEAARHDIELAKPLVRDGGILCGDDLELQLHDYPAAKDYAAPGIDVVQPRENGPLFHPGVTVAVAEAFGPVSCWFGLWAVQKTGNEWRAVDLNNMPMCVPPFLPREHQLSLKLWMIELIQS